MNIYDYSNYPTLSVCGDIHGEFKTLIYNIKRLGIENSVIIIAGDCGVGFEKIAHYEVVYNAMRKTLNATNNIILLVRGNHDDPSYFSEQKINFERFKTIPDYSVVKVADKRVLCIGGAISVDRIPRLERMAAARASAMPLYWREEWIKYHKEALDALSNDVIDTVITHTCPSFCYPTTKSGIEKWLAIDPDLENDLSVERNEVDKIYKHLTADSHPIKHWLYGHFHKSHSEIIDNISFTLLDIMEIKQVY